MYEYTADILETKRKYEVTESCSPEKKQYLITTLNTALIGITPGITDDMTIGTHMFKKSLTRVLCFNYQTKILLIEDFIFSLQNHCIK
jgi:hypothetical protein